MSVGIKSLIDQGLTRHGPVRQVQGFEIHNLDLTPLAIRASAFTPFVISTRYSPPATIDAGGVAVPSWEQWAWLAALLAVPGTGHMLMNWSHNHVRLVIASMLTLAIPVISTIGAVLFLDEALNGIQVVGMAVVLGALAVVVRREAELRTA